MAEFLVSCAQHTGEIFLQTNSTDGKVYTLKVCRLGVSTHRMSRTPPGNLKPEKRFGFWKSVSSALSDVEIFPLFTSEIAVLLKSEQKWLRYQQKTPCIGGSSRNENNCRQKTAFVAWPARTDAQSSMQPSSFVLFSCLFY